MTGSSKRKGDRAEREVAAILADLTGFDVRRQLGAGRADDVGDLDGIPDTVIQVADWADVLRAVRVKPIEVEAQRHNAGATFAVSAVRMRGGLYRFVCDPAQMATWIREAT